MKGVYLEITEGGKAKKIARHLLCDLSPNYTVSEGRLWSGVKTGVVGVIISMGIAWRMAESLSEDFVGFSVIPVVFAISFLYVAVLSLPKRKLVSFMDTQGSFAFSILVVKKQENELEHFLRDLTSIIKQKANNSNQTPEPTTTAGMPAAGQQSRQP